MLKEWSKDQEECEAREYANLEQIQAKTREDEARKREEEEERRREEQLKESGKRSEKARREYDSTTESPKGAS
jgi:hypothetical protein